jgi:uncharacterized membrane protein
LSDYVFILLLGLHVAGVISWMGASVMYGSVLGPSFSKSDLVETKPEFAISVMSKFSRFITGASLLTIIAGFFLFDYISTVATTILPPGSRILFIYAGAVLGFAAFVVTLASVIPSTSRIVKILKSGVLSETTESNLALVNSRRLQIRHSLRAIRSGLGASAALLLLIFVLMILGTNL